jgi:hypothetical protein
VAKNRFCAWGNGVNLGCVGAFWIRGSPFSMRGRRWAGEAEIEHERWRGAVNMGYLAGLSLMWYLCPFPGTELGFRIIDFPEE